MTGRFPTCVLGAVAELYDSLHRTPQYAEEGYPMIRVTDIHRGFVKTEGALRVDGETYLQFSKKHKPQVGDTLFSRVGSYGNSSYVNRIEEFCLGQNTVCISPEKSRIEPYFLYSSLNSDDLRHQIESLVGGASQGTISLNSIRKLEIPTPPLPAQRRIAGILSAYDELMENSQRRIRILEAMARAFYREWFVYFRFPGHEKLPHLASPFGDLPQGWEVVPLSSLVDFAKGRKPAETRPEPLPGDVKLLLIDSLHGGEAVFASPPKLVLAETSDTIMVMDGASSCEVTIGSSGAVGSTLGRFRTTRQDSFSPHALYRFLEAKAEEFKSKNIGAAIPHANKDYILTQSVALPPKAIASSFHTQLEPIQGMIERLKAKIQNLRRTRDLLLPRLLSGEIELTTSQKA